MTYERYTAAPVRDVLRLAGELLPQRIPLERSGGDGHSLQLSGPDGVVTITAHPHGTETLVVAQTNRLRTERIDLETQYFMHQLPYQPGDKPTG